MTNTFKQCATNVYWSYRWTLGDHPTVFFSNPRIKTNVIYTMDELKSVLERSDKENDFIPVPRHVLLSALKSIDTEKALAA